MVEDNIYFRRNVNSMIATRTPKKKNNEDHVALGVIETKKTWKTE